jgi:hypothetical protein
MQARQLTVDAKNQRDAEADERKKTKALHREALESKTQILRKRIPGQVDQPRPMFTLPPPDTV